jgi:hypothetical protein
LSRSGGGSQRLRERHLLRREAGFDHPRELHELLALCGHRGCDARHLLPNERLQLRTSRRQSGLCAGHPRTRRPPLDRRHQVVDRLSHPLSPGAVCSHLYVRRVHGEDFL